MYIASMHGHQATDCDKGHRERRTNDQKEEEIADYLSQNNTTNGNIDLTVTLLTAITDDQISFLKKHGIEAVVLNAISVAHVERESDNEEDGTKTSVDRD